MGKYANFYDGVRKLLDKVADALDPGAADTKTANYQTAVLNSLERIGDKVGDVVSATLPDASAATDGDTLVVDDGEWTIGSGGGGGTGGGALLKVGVTVEEGVATMDKTWTEINTAFNSGLVFVILWDEAEHSNYLYIVDLVGEAAGMYAVALRNIEMNNTSFFMASSADGYPVCSDF